MSLKIISLISPLMIVVFDFVFRERDNEGESFVHNLVGGWEQGGFIPCDDAASS